MLTLTGKFVYEDNTPVANGILVLTLSQPCNISGTAQIAPLRKIVQLDANGAIPGSTQVYGNDALTPSGTTYQAVLYTGVLNPATGVYGPGAQIFSQNWSLTGSSVAVDTLTPTTNGASYVAPVTSVGLTMPGEFSVSNSPVTSSGTIVVAKVNQSANQVYAGPTTGAAAAPGFRALVDADLPTTMAGKTLTSPTINTPTVSSPTTTGTDTGAETLKNKTLTGASMGNGVTKVTSIDNSGAITGTGAAVVFFTYNLPASTMQAGKGIRITVGVSHTGSATVAFTMDFGSQTGINIGSGNGGAMIWTITILNKAGVTNAQTALVLGGVGASTLGINAFTATQDTTAQLTINMKFSVANTDSVTPIQFLVEQIQ